MKDNIKKAMDLAEQEVQEKEIAQLKSIIKDLLQKKVDREEDKRELEKEISVIKQTIDDFKAGRLDKVKELIEKDSTAKNVLPFKVVIINQPVYVQPWNWTYRIEPIYLQTQTNYSYLPTQTFTSTSASTIGGSNYLTGNNGSCSSTSYFVGTVASNFTGGAYEVNGAAGSRIINL